MKKITTLLPYFLLGTLVPAFFLFVFEELYSEMGRLSPQASSLMTAISCFLFGAALVLSIFHLVLRRSGYAKPLRIGSIPSLFQTPVFSFLYTIVIVGCFALLLIYKSLGIPLFQLG